MDLSLSLACPPSPLLACPLVLQPLCLSAAASLLKPTSCLLCSAASETVSGESESRPGSESRLGLVKKSFINSKQSTSTISTSIEGERLSGRLSRPVRRLGVEHTSPTVGRLKHLGKQTCSMCSAMFLEAFATAQTPSGPTATRKVWRWRSEDWRHRTL